MTSAPAPGATAGRRAYVHIGLGKTGTTVIQRSLYDARARLARDFGVLYPAIAANHSGPLRSMFVDAPETLPFFAQQGMSDAAGVRRRVAGFRAAFEDAFDRSTAPVILLSGEGVSWLPSTGVEQLVAWLRRWVEEVVVVACLRAPLEWMSSATQEQVKRGWTLEELRADPYLPRYRERLEPWVAAVGPEQVRVYDFATARCHEAGLVGCLLSHVDLPTDAVAAPSGRRANESLCVEAVHLLSALNVERRRGAEQRPRPYRRAEVAPFRKLSGTPFRIDAATRAEAETAVQADGAWLEETFAFAFAEAERTSVGVEPFDAAAQRSLARLIIDLDRSRSWRGLLGPRGGEAVQGWIERARQEAVQLRASPLVRLRALRFRS